jgi:hypothetical protein
MTKPIYKSKTFWVNLLTAAAEVTEVLPIPSGTALIASNVVNIALRWVTSQPVGLTED